MTTLPIYLASAPIALALVLAAPAQASEPLVWTELADPDPHFVPPPEPRAARKREKAAPRRQASAEEQEAYDAGRSLAETLKAIEALEQAAAKAMDEARMPDEPQP